MRTKLVLLTNSDIIGQGIRQLLADSPHFVLAAVCNTPERAEQNVILHGADMLLLDPRMIDYSQRNSVRRLFPEATLVALLLHYVEQEHLHQYDGVVEITASRKELDRLLLAALNTRQSVGPLEEAGNSELSRRETEVLIGLAKGLQNKEIADQLCISVHTVVSHRKNIIEKTGIKSVAGLAVYALMKNLIDGDSLI